MVPIKSIQDQGTLTLQWINEISSYRGDKNELLYEVSCVFSQGRDYKSFKVPLTYWPHLISGTTWKNGECANILGNRYDFSFEISDQYYTSEELSKHLGINLKGKKKFFYIPSDKITSHSKNFKEFEGILIPQSVIALYYLINSDNMLFDALFNPTGDPHAYNKALSFELEKKHGKKCIYLNKSTPLHDGLFWCRILYNPDFYECFFKMKEAIYYNSFNEVKSSHVEAKFPFTGINTIKVIGRKYYNYLLVDAITYHHNEWDGYSDIGLFKEQSGQAASNIDKEDLEHEGHNHVKNYSADPNTMEPITEPYDPSMKHLKNFNKFKLRDAPIPGFTRLEKEDQKTYSTSSAEDVGNIHTATLSPYSQSDSNLPKADITQYTTLEDPNKEVPFERDYTGPNAIDKLLDIQAHLKNKTAGVISCDFVVVREDKFKRHTNQYVNVFPIPDELGISKSNSKWEGINKFTSKKYVPKKLADYKRKPPFGYDIDLRGAVIVEVQVEKGFFYIMEIEPNGSVARQFNTYLISVTNFKKISSEQAENLLSIIAQSRGVYDPEIFAQSPVYDIRRQPGGFTEDHPIKSFADDIINWIEEI